MERGEILLLAERVLFGIDCIDRAFGNAYRAVDAVDAVDRVDGEEMLFGFAAAVIVGFLLAAGMAWTGLATQRGPVLGALVPTWAGVRPSAGMAIFPSLTDTHSGVAAANSAAPR